MPFNWKEKQDITDPIPVQMLEAYHTGSNSDTSPCSVCRGLGSHVMVRNHFHGSDIGACARKTYLTMTTGIKSSSSSSKAFLLDGHLHEASILELIKEGFGNQATIIPAKNEQEVQKSIPIAGNDGVGLVVMRIIGHYDGMIETDDIKAVLECKSVKDYTWDKVKGGEISNEWYGQIQFYMAATGLNRSYLIVKNRTTSQILKPIRIDLNVGYLKERIGKLKEIYKKIHMIDVIDNPVTMPDKEHKKASESECKFCPHRNRCWNTTEMFIPEDDPVHSAVQGELEL